MWTYLWTFVIPLNLFGSFMYIWQTTLLRPSCHVQSLSTWFMNDPKIRPPPPNLQGRIYDPIWLKNICVSGTWITRPDFKKLVLPKNCRIFITLYFLILKTILKFQSNSIILWPFQTNIKDIQKLKIFTHDTIIDSIFRFSKWKGQKT